MASDFLIGYPDIPSQATRWVAASTISGTANEDSDQPTFNIFRGEKWHYWRSSSNATGHYVSYDLGPSVTSTASFLAVARADNAITRAGLAIRLRLQAGTDGSTFGTSAVNAAISANDLLGPRSEDYFTTFSATSAFRYWRFAIEDQALTTAFPLLCSSVYFGTLFDMGVELSDYEVDFITSVNDEFRGDTGAFVPTRLDFPRLRIVLRWEGVTDAKKKSFLDTIYSRRVTTPCFLYTTTFHDPLDGNRVVYARLEDAAIVTPVDRTDWNVVETSWVEAIG